MLFGSWNKLSVLFLKLLLVCETLIADFFVAMADINQIINVVAVQNMANQLLDFHLVSLLLLKTSAYDTTTRREGEVVAG